MFGVQVSAQVNRRCRKNVQTFSWHVASEEKNANFRERAKIIMTVPDNVKIPAHFANVSCYNLQKLKCQSL